MMRNSPMFVRGVGAVILHHKYPPISPPPYTYPPTSQYTYFPCNRHLPPPCIANYMRILTICRHASMQRTHLEYCITVTRHAARMQRTQSKDVITIPVQCSLCSVHAASLQIPFGMPYQNTACIEKGNKEVSFFLDCMLPVLRPHLERFLNYPPPIPNPQKNILNPKS